LTTLTTFSVKRQDRKQIDVDKVAVRFAHLFICWSRRFITRRKKPWDRGWPFSTASKI